MAPTPDLLAVMSGFRLIPSGITSGSDVPDAPGIREVMTHSGPIAGTNFSVGCLDNSSADQ